MLRGKKKVATEFGLVAIAHNLMKKAAVKGSANYFEPIKHTYTSYLVKMVFNSCFRLSLN